MASPTTPTGKRLHDEAWDWPCGLTVDGHSNDPAACPACDVLLAIEAEAAAAERERWLDVARQVVHYADLTADTVREGEDLRSVMDAWTATVEMCRASLAALPEDSAMTAATWAARQES